MCNTRRVLCKDNWQSGKVWIQLIDSGAITNCNSHCEQKSSYNADKSSETKATNMDLKIDYYTHGISDCRALYSVHEVALTVDHIYIINEQPTIVHDWGRLPNENNASCKTSDTSPDCTSISTDLTLPSLCGLGKTNTASCSLQQLRYWEELWWFWGWVGLGWVVTWREYEILLPALFHFIVL